MNEGKMPKSYDFHEVEKRIYPWWEERGFFTPTIDPNQEPFTISMPPPNVTGELHLGHVMFVAVEDLMTRHSRMKGAPTLWLPGTDHAGIATQLQVEKYLRQEKGMSRKDIGREAFIEETWEWKRKFGGIITEQLRKLGASCDWSRERFTMDEGLSRAVREAFVRLYEAGLVYRGTYLINWSPGLQTAVSDLEVEYFEEPATMYYFRYPLADSDDFIPVATTRPETILGDTAVAIHPEDERFKEFLGKECMVPILERRIPVISDGYVDLDFGTGALKITPGHDPNDYEIGKVHGLDIINVLNPDATMNEAAGPYQGLDRYECRERLWSDMKRAGLTIKTEPYLMQIPRSQRGGEVVEPMISTQWFVRMKPLADPALEVVEQGEIEIIPEHFRKVYFNWLENIRDWCISRQLWWGHRIPAWHCQECGEITVAREDPDHCEHCSSGEIHQDPDVLDTWFSSGLWPFSTLGWPEDTEDYRYFYPTTVMETGYDILFFWVARMIMMGLRFTDQVPFSTVYLHGLFRAESGEKMSKSKDNVVDPLEVIDEYGTDALRFSLLTGSTPGKDMKLSMERVEANRNFANKIWNAGRLIFGLLAETPYTPDSLPEPSLADRWITARKGELLRDVNRLFEGYQIGEAGRQIYDFFWGEFADWYLEIAKLKVREGGGRAWRTASIFIDIYDTCLRLLHPFMPFVTEELWGRLVKACQEHPSKWSPEGDWGEALIVARWPSAQPAETWEQGAIEEFTLIQELITTIRNVRAERDVDPSREIEAVIYAADRAPLLESNQRILCSLARVNQGNLIIKEGEGEGPTNSVPLVVGKIQAFLPLEGMFNLEGERARLTEELAELQEEINRLEDLLEGPFSSKAPEEIVQKEADKLQDYRQRAIQLQDQLALMS